MTQPPAPPPDFDKGPARAAARAAERDWPGYFKAVLGKPARDTTTRALALFEAEKPARQRLAVDVACGEGRDTFELLRRGWRVVALDGSSEAFDLLVPRVPADQRDRLVWAVSDFGAMEIPRAELVNASYSLPFCPPADFPGLWSRIVAALPAGGRFAGQFFGDRDGWAGLADRSHQTRSQLDRLLDAFVIEWLSEEEKEESTALASPKHWHVFHVVARRR